MNSSFWVNKKVLVTGHTGFKGSWLCLWLYKMGAKVSGLSLLGSVTKPDMFSALSLDDIVKDYRGNIFDYDICLETINKIEPEIVFHMAAQPLVRRSYTNPIETYKTNVIGTANILEAILSSKLVKSIVAITTDKCYENIEKDYAYLETDPLGGHDPYSSSKACAEHVVSAYFRSFYKGKDIGLATARAGNVIGGGDWANDRLVPDMIRSWSANKNVLIRNPKSTRPWQHVLEPLSGYLTLAEKLSAQPHEYSSAWNFGPDKYSVKTVEDSVKLAMQFWGPSAGWVSSNDNQLHEATLLNLNSDKAKNNLSWYQKWNLEKSISQTIKWYKIYYQDPSLLFDFSNEQIDDYLIS